jgi:hypothetical protein
VAGKYASKDGSIIPSAKVRAYLYTIVTAASPIVVARGLLDASEVGLWVALGGAILGVTNAVALANTGERTR